MGRKLPTPRPPPDPDPVPLAVPQAPDRRQFLLRHYTAAEVMAILAAIVTVLGAFSVGTVNIITALQTTAVVEQTLEATQRVGDQVSQVHDVTNANLSAVKAELALALQQITALREMVGDLRSQRDAAGATAIPGAARPTPVVIENTPGQAVPVIVKPGATP